jgi:hypothetical protein
MNLSQDGVMINAYKYFEGTSADGNDEVAVGRK